MEDIGDLLFYIIAGLFAIVGAISRSKKGKAVMFPRDVSGNEPTTVMPERGNRPGSYFPEIVEESIDWDETATAEYADNEPVPMTKRESFIPDPSKEGSYIEPMTSFVPDEGISSLEIRENEFIHLGIPDEITTGTLPAATEESSIASDLAASFNLPEAIIWSEIINRKEYF